MLCLSYLPAFVSTLKVCRTLFHESLKQKGDCFHKFVSKPRHEASTQAYMSVKGFNNISVKMGS